MDLSVIIKAYNEEENIDACIASVLRECRSVKRSFEVIVSDSGSQDRTVALAKKRPVRIVTTEGWRRSASSSLYAGWLASTGDLVYVIDGDMVMERGVLKKLLVELEKDNRLAGVEGRLNEPYAGNIISKRAGVRMRKAVSGDVDYLDGGALYRRSAILQAGGHISNPWLFSGEESELGFRLRVAGFRLRRLALVTRKHFFYTNSSVHIMLDKFSRGYFFGFGQVLRLSLRKGYFWRYARKVLLYLCMLAYLILFFASAVLSFLDWRPLVALLVLLVLVFFALWFKRRSAQSSVLSLLSWGLQALGIVGGFILGAGRPFPDRIKEVHP